MPPKSTPKPALDTTKLRHHGHVLLAAADERPTDWAKFPELGIEIGAMQGGGALGARSVNLFIRPITEDEDE